jgi:Pectate lyase superfamily protein
MRGIHSTIRKVRSRRRCLPQIEGFERRALLSGVGPVGVASSAPAALSTATTAAYMVSVTAFGATGNGITDDAPAIQAALDSVPATGGTVFVPAGDYRLGESLVIGQSNITLTGVGPASILRLMDGVQVDAIDLPVAYGNNIDPSVVVSGDTISNLTIDGNHNPLAASGQPNYFGILASQTNNLTLSGLTVQNWIYDGIEIGNASEVPDNNTVIENCVVTGTGRNGIAVGYATNTTINDNIITDAPSQYWGPAAGNGIDVEIEGGSDAPNPYVNGLIIENNVISQVGATTSCWGIALQDAYGPMSNITILDNAINGYQQAVGISSSLGDYGEVAGVSGVTIQGNWIGVDPNFSVAGYPLYIGGSDNVNIIDNVMNDQTDGNFSYDGAVVVDGSENVLVQGNTIRLSQDNNSDAIVDAINGSTDIQVVNNDYQTSGSTQVTGDGTATGVTTSGNVDISGTPWNVTPPTLSFNIADGTVITSPTQIVVNSTESARVYFFVDGVPQGFSDTAPYVFTFDPSQYTAGPHELEAMAVDQSANLSTESNVSVQVGVSAQAGTGLAVGTASGVYGGTTTLTATLTSGGAPVGNEPVLFTLNGTAVGSAVTNGNGVATLPGVRLTGIARGTYAGAVAASFAGDADYTGSGGSTSLVVTQAGTLHRRA